MDWSVIADGVRKTVNDYSYGIFGNGYMKRQPGETDKQYNDRLAKGLGAASAAFNSTIKPTMSVKDSFIKGVSNQTVKQWLPWVVVAGVGIFIFKKSKKGVKRNRR